MSQTISVAEMTSHFAEYLDRVAGGERILLVRGEQPIAELRPVPFPPGKPLAELPRLLASLPRLSQTEAEQFEQDLETSRAALARQGLDDPWRP